MFKIKLQLCLFIILNYFHDATTVNYSPYDNKQHHQQHLLLQGTNYNKDGGYDTQQSRPNENPPLYRQNVQGNGNYQQMYRYYYTPPSYQQQQQTLLPKQPTQLWFGPPIVAEDDIQQQQQQQQHQQSSTNIPPPALYQQHSTSNIIRSGGELLPFLQRNSKVLPPTVYNPQPTTIRTAQFIYNTDNNNNNNNNNNIAYHRHQIAGIPESQHEQGGIASWNQRQQQYQQQQQQYQLLQQQQQQQQEQQRQFYVTNTNLRYNGISNDLTSLRKENIMPADYGEYFKRYLENNPQRIKPIY